MLAEHIAQTRRGADEFDFARLARNLHAVVEDMRRDKREAMKLFYALRRLVAAIDDTRLLIADDRVEPVIAAARTLPARHGHVRKPKTP